MAGTKQPVLTIPNGPYMRSASAENLAHFENVCKQLQNAGYELRHISAMPDFEEIRARHDVIMSAEAAQVHDKWFENYRDLYSAKFSELIARGKSVTGAQLQAALAARDQFRAAMIRTMDEQGVDLWISPSTIGAAPKGLDSTGDPVMNLPWTQAGLPAMNLPSGKSAGGLPLGLQVVGNWNKDELLLLWAKDLEKALSKR
jgi:Asp-tRNA(Asn)/Glu-tRNA(Gln) amidotransferase A subunit family amidase